MHNYKYNKGLPAREQKCDFLFFLEKISSWRSTRSRSFTLGNCAKRRKSKSALRHRSVNWNIRSYIDRRKKSPI